MKRLFSLPMILRNIFRGLLPGLVAFVVTGGVRLLADQSPRTETTALMELGLFAMVSVVATFALERSLLSEIVAYLRNRRPARAADAPAG
jgi:hypothetical protein